MNSRTRTLLFVNGAFLLILVGIGVVLLVADRNNTSTTQATATVPTLALSSLPSSETEVTLGIICTTPRDATDTLVGAWIAGEKTASARCADQAVVDRLFQGSGAGAQWIFQGCDGPDPGVPQCQYSYEGGGVTFTLAGTEVDGWRVTAVEFIAD